MEGDTELYFVHKCMIPYLYSKGLQNAINAQKITTNRRLNKKGGNIGFEYFRNEVMRVAAQGNVLITTMLDFFRLPNDFPNHSLNKLEVPEIECGIRAELSGVFPPQCFLPYIQIHEIESLMYTNMDGFELVVDREDQQKELREIIESYENPEDINGGAETAPSKRLKKIFNYEKTADGEMILEALNIDDIRVKCPHFNEWLTKLEEGVRNDHF